jgi:hypothetical protein
MKEILVSMYLGYDKDGDYYYVAVSEEGIVPCISSEPRDTGDEWETPEGFETWSQLGMDADETINDYTDVELIWTAMVPYGYKLNTFEDE